MKLLRNIVEGIGQTIAKVFTLGISEKDKQEIVKTKQTVVRQYLMQDSLTCRCKGLAVPVYNTTNKYVCVKCNFRFANARHNITKNIDQHSDDPIHKISSITYNKVVDQLIEEYK